MSSNSFVSIEFSRSFQPTPTHYFLRLLNDKNKILRIFTQVRQNFILKTKKRIRFFFVEHRLVGTCRRNSSGENCRSPRNIFQFSLFKMSKRIRFRIYERFDSIFFVDRLEFVLFFQKLFSKTKFPIVSIVKASWNQVKPLRFSSSSIFIETISFLDIVFFGEGLPPRFRECLQSVSWSIRKRNDRIVKILLLFFFLSKGFSQSGFSDYHRNFVKSRAV